MVADVRKSGMIMILTENKIEALAVKNWVKENAVDTKDFVDCCGRRKCAFRVKLKADDNK